MPTLSLDKTDKPIAYVSSTNQTLDKQILYIDTNISDKDEITSFTIKEGTFFPILNLSPQMNLRLGIYGRSGSGKSFMAGKVLNYLCNKYNLPVHIFSAVGHDEALDIERGKYRQLPIRYDIYADGVVDGINFEDFKDTIVVFDDIEKTNDEKISKKLMSLRDTILFRGRHLNINLINVSHDVLGGKETKRLHSEENCCIIYPKYNTAHSIRNYLNKYMGLSNKQVEFVRNQPTRGCFISNTAMQYCITEKSIFMFD
jgi:hypothetical protein